MNGLRTKHKILKYYLSEIEKATIKVPPPKIDLLVYSKSVKGVSENDVATNLLEMMYQRYVTFYPTGTGHQLVEITTKGIEAVIAESFIKKSNEIFWKAFMNISLTGANIVVAIAAVVALNANNGELQKLKDRLIILEGKVNQQQVKPNPKIEPSKNVQPVLLDTSKTHKKGHL